MGTCIKTEKSLVNRIDLDFRREPLKGLHDAQTHVAVESVIGTEHGHVMSINDVLDAEDGCAHLQLRDPFHLWTARDDAAVVIGEYDDT